MNTNTDTYKPAMIRSLERNGTFMPGITRVIYNLKTEETVVVTDADGNPIMETFTLKDGTSAQRRKRTTRKLDNPILATTVYFNDGTKVTVVNSINDKVDLATEKVTRNGVTVEAVTASKAAKESGLVYAICKRAFGKPDENGTIIGDGFGRKLGDIVDGAYDELIEDKYVKALKEKNRAEHKAREDEAKANPKKKYCLRDVVAELTTVVSMLREEVAALKPESERR